MPRFIARSEGLGSRVFEFELAVLDCQTVSLPSMMKVTLGLPHVLPVPAASAYATSGHRTSARCMCRMVERVRVAGGRRGPCCTRSLGRQRRHRALAVRGRQLLGREREIGPPRTLSVAWIHFRPVARGDQKRASTRHPHARRKSQHALHSSGQPYNVSLRLHFRCRSAASGRRR